MDAQIRFLMEFAVILAVAGLTAVIFTKMKMPVVIGYLTAGILVGPYLFHFDLITDMDTVNSLANLGIILLMFTIGLDFNIRKLRKTGMFSIVAGSDGAMWYTTSDNGYGLSRIVADTTVKAASAPSAPWGVSATAGPAVRNSCSVCAVVVLTPFHATTTSSEAASAEIS